MIRVEAGMPTSRFTSVVGVPERTYRRWQQPARAGPRRGRGRHPPMLPHEYVSDLTSPTQRRLLRGSPVRPLAVFFVSTTCSLCGETS